MLLIRPLLPNISSKQLSICSTYRVWQVKTLITIMRQSIIDIVLQIQVVLYQLQRLLWFSSFLSPSHRPSCALFSACPQPPDDNNRPDLPAEDSLPSKRFRLVSEQRKTEELDSLFWLREKWNESQGHILPLQIQLSGGFEKEKLQNFTLAVLKRLMFKACIDHSDSLIFQHKRCSHVPFQCDRIFRKKLRRINQQRLA